MLPVVLYLYTSIKPTMKNFKLVLVFAALLFTSFSEPPVTPAAVGIHFQNLTLQQALTKAKQQHKYVFLNAYAVWCAPCKQLKKTTFQTAKVSNLVNKDCVSIDVDVEKGEGISIAKKYQIQGHPLMLVLNSEGKVVKRILGYMDADQFMQEVNGVLK